MLNSRVMASFAYIADSSDSSVATSLSYSTYTSYIATLARASSFMSLRLHRGISTAVLSL